MFVKVFFLYFVCFISLIKTEARLSIFRTTYFAQANKYITHFIFLLKRTAKGTFFSIKKQINSSFLALNGLHTHFLANTPQAVLLFICIQMYVWNYSTVI